jgi:hypothetical protein
MGKESSLYGPHFPFRMKTLPPGFSKYKTFTLQNTGSPNLSTLL